MFYCKIIIIFKCRRKKVKIVILVMELYKFILVIKFYVSVFTLYKNKVYGYYCGRNIVLDFCIGFCGY